MLLFLQYVEVLNYLVESSGIYRRSASQVDCSSFVIFNNIRYINNLMYELEQSALCYFSMYPV